MAWLRITALIRHKSILLTALLAATACGGGQAENGSHGHGAESPKPSDATTRCAPILTPQLDHESIVAVLGSAKPEPAKVESLKDRAGQAFGSAAESLCRSGKLDAKLLRPFRTLIIQNGSGATEATFYEDPHEFSGEDLIFQWTFAESGLEVPPQDDIEAGLLCWAHPDRSECAEREP